MPDPRNQKVVAYLKELVEVGQKYGLSLSHEDSHGAFQVECASEYNEEWLMRAHDATGVEVVCAPWNPLEG